MQNQQRDDGIAIKYLRDQLEDASISTSEWGKGEAKTLQHLYKEIADGETVLTQDDDARLVRRVVVGGADVFYESPNGDLYRLKEDRQVFTNGRERRRDLGQAVSEKMKPNENPIEAMIRGVKEELGIEGSIKLSEEGTSEETIDSPSYPGLKSTYVRHRFRVTLNHDQFIPEGYVEVQKDKRTYFIWERIDNLEK